MRKQIFSALYNNAYNICLLLGKILCLPYCRDTKSGSMKAMFLSTF